MHEMSYTYEVYKYIEYYRIICCNVFFVTGCAPYYNKRSVRACCENTKEKSQENPLEASGAFWVRFLFFARCVWYPFRSLLLLTCTVLAAVTWQLEHVATCHGTRENFVLRAIMTDLEAKYYKALVIMNDLNVSCAWCTLHSPVGKHQKSVYCIQYTVYIVSLQPNQTDH